MNPSSQTCQPSDARQGHGFMGHSGIPCAAMANRQAGPAATSRLPGCRLRWLAAVRLRRSHAKQSFTVRFSISGHTGDEFQCRRDASGSLTCHYRRRRTSPAGRIIRLAGMGGSCACHYNGGYDWERGGSLPSNAAGLKQKGGRGKVFVFFV
jgi:hypothetical protein